MLSLIIVGTWIILNKVCVLCDMILLQNIPYNFNTSIIFEVWISVFNILWACVSQVLVESIPNFHYFCSLYLYIYWVYGFKYLDVITNFNPAGDDNRQSKWHYMGEYNIFCNLFMLFSTTAAYSRSNTHSTLVVYSYYIILVEPP